MVSAMKSAQDEREIAKAWLMTAVYYGREVPNEVLKMYCADVAGYSVVEVLEALKRYRRNPANRTMPLPAQIVALIDPEADAEFTARGYATELANKLCAMVEKRDYTWSQYENFNEEFLEAFGQDAWLIVKERGGWARFCEQFWNQDRGVFLAQLRDRIEHQKRKRTAQSRQKLLNYKTGSNITTQEQTTNGN